MFKDSYPVRWAGRQAVVVLPEHIGQANAGQVSEELLSVINRGADPLIVDMTATISCDYTGADALLRAHQRAGASGTELRLVVTAPIVRRALGLSGLNRLISIYPSLEAAAAAREPAAAAGPPNGDNSGAVTPEVLREVLDTLSRAELSLRAVLRSSRDAARPRIAEALRHLADGIREIRDITPAAPRQGTASPHAPPHGAERDHPQNTKTQGDHDERRPGAVECR